MSAATSTIPALGRTAPPFMDLSVIPVTFVLSATPYATASGGVAVDLTVALSSGAQPAGLPFINPLDVIGILPACALTTNGFFPSELVVGAPISTNPAGYPFAGGFQSNYIPGGSDLGPQVRPTVGLATCPATFRLFGTGAANHGAFSEVADGNITDTVPVFLVIARNGPNS